MFWLAVITTLTTEICWIPCGWSPWLFCRSVTVILCRTPTADALWLYAPASWYVCLLLTLSARARYRAASDIAMVEMKIIISKRCLQRPKIQKKTKRKQLENKKRFEYILMMKNKMIIIRRRILTIGRIAVLTPLVVANEFVRPWTHLIRASLGPHESSALWHLDRFSRFWVHRSKESQCFSVGRTTPTNCPFPFGICTPSNTWFLWPTRFSPKRHLDRLSRFCRAYERGQQTDRETDRHTDRQRYSVCGSSPLSPNNSNNFNCRILTGIGSDVWGVMGASPPREMDSVGVVYREVLICSLLLRE